MNMKKRIGAAILCISMVLGIVTSNPNMVRAEEKEYKRIICHNTETEYYAAVNEEDDTMPYAATGKDYGWDYTVWIEEDTGVTTEAGNRIVRLKNYAANTYIGVENDALAMMTGEDSNAVKWEVEIKKDYEGAWGSGQPDFSWNAYKTLNSSRKLYVCTEGLNNTPGGLKLEQAKDDWWSSQWKYETVAANELLNQPGAAAAPEEVAALSAKINEIKGILANADVYQTNSLKKLEAAALAAEKICQYSKVTGAAVNASLEALAAAVSELIQVADAPLYAAGEMAIAGQEMIGDQGQYYLDFAEEFNNDILNSDIWLDEYLPHWTPEEEDSKARYEIREGKLALQIRKEDQPWSPNDGNVICSGITTFNKNYLHNFSGNNTLYEHNDSGSTDNNFFNGYTTQYGYVEMRAKLENDGGQGHQALWLVGTQSDAVNWVDSSRTAEIDMLETSFYDSYQNWRLCGYGWNDRSFCPSWNTFDAGIPAGDPGKEYHTYGMEWTPEKLNFYYDGQYYKSIDYSPQYEMGIILSIYQNAGWSTGDRPSGEDWPKEFLVDYIRIYKPVGGYDNGYVDKTTLIDKVKKAKKEAAKTDIFTMETIEKLKTVINNADGVIQNDNALKADVISQISTLTKAVNELQKLSDQPVLPSEDIIQPEKRNISECSIIVEEDTWRYDGKEIKPSLILQDAAQVLKQDTDFTVRYENNRYPGTASIIITAADTSPVYTGSITKTFTISKGNQIIKSKQQYRKTYGSKAFALNAKLAEGDGKLTYSTDNKKVGVVSSKGKITLKGTGSAVITVKAGSTSYYNSSKIKITIHVMPKKQQAQIKMLGGRKLKITWKRDSSASGYRIQYSKDKKFKKNVKTISVKGNKAVSKKIGKLTKENIYYVRVCAYKTTKTEGKSVKLYGSWSSIKKSGKIK